MNHTMNTRGMQWDREGTRSESRLKFQGTSLKAAGVISTHALASVSGSVSLCAPPDPPSWSNSANRPGGAVWIFKLIYRRPLLPNWVFLFVPPRRVFPSLPGRRVPEHLNRNTVIIPNQRCDSSCTWNA